VILATTVKAGSVTVTMISRHDIKTAIMVLIKKSHGTVTITLPERNFHYFSSSGQTSFLAVLTLVL
jgi:hypothetical protein